jgi:hypothetical protein
MCGGVGDLVEDALKASVSSRNLMSGGLSAIKDTQMAAHRSAVSDLRDRGLLPAKKVQADPAAERAAAAASATQAANSRIAMQRKAMRENSLLTGGGRSTLGV